MKLSKGAPPDETWVSEGTEKLISGLVVSGLNPTSIKTVAAASDDSKIVDLPKCSVETGLKPFFKERVQFPGVSGSYFLSSWKGGRFEKGKALCKFVRRLDRVDSSGACSSIVRDEVKSPFDEQTNSDICLDEDMFSKELGKLEDLFAVIVLPKEMGLETWLLIEGKQWERHFVQLIQLDSKFKVINKLEGQAGGA